MNVYMVQDTISGLFYLRRCSGGDCWVEQKKASIWTNKIGPTQALTYAYHFKKQNPVIRTYQSEEINE